MNYYVLVLDRDIPGTAIFKKHPPEVLERVKGYKFSKAISLEKDFPVDARYQMSSDYPDDRLLTDMQDNVMGLLIVSEPLANIIEEVKNNVELLPIKLLDHRGKIAGDKYFIANIIGTIQCLDEEKSDVVASELNENEIFGIEKLVIDKAKIPDDTHIFRLGKMPRLILISEVIKNKIEEENLNGMLIIDLDQFNTTRY